MSSDGGGDNSSLEAQLVEDFKEPKEIDTRLTIQARNKIIILFLCCETTLLMLAISSPHDVFPYLVGKSKKTKKKREKKAHSVKEALNSPENGGVTDHDVAYTISSGNEDCSKGIKSNGSTTSVILHV